MKIGMNAKRIIKMVALALAGVAAITAVAFGVKAIVDYTRNDLKTINPSFEVGSLGSDGKYVADECSLYTKEAFGCYGLQVKPDFDSGVDYQVFYYDILDNFVSSSEVLSEGYSAEAPLNGAYARMVITPREDEDGKIGFTEKIKYSNQITVKFKKEQDIDERFTSYKGKLLQVVSSVSDSVFVAGVSITNTTLAWYESETINSVCTTTQTVLKVEGFNTINFSSSSLDEKFGNSIVRIYEFSDISLDDSIILSSHEYLASFPYKLNKSAKYIIISVSSNSENAWDSASLNKLPLCFTVTKSK